MDERIEEVNSGAFIRNALFAIKRNVLLILAVIILFTAGGMIYSSTVKPEYTASVKVRYKVDDTSGKGVEDVNAMRAYIDTVVDFVDEGVVLDRANYYYTKWSNDQNTDFDIEDVELNYASTYDRKETNEKIEWIEIKKNKISVATSTADNYTRFFFSIRYTDPDKEAAIEKAQILALAFKNELQSKTDSGAFVYFNKLEIDVEGKGIESPPSSNVSKGKIIFTALLLGVVVAAVIVYVKTVLDNTVKSKEELEEITETKLLSMLGEQGGDK
ncbi:MAG: hypothetical protein J6C62_02540 [Clostridia bacterium]|nr:hypothetical protein [Clostridia bacterium]